MVRSAVSNRETHIVHIQTLQRRRAGAATMRRITRLEQDVILFVRNGNQADRPRMSFRN
jgi:hypothetical protein